MKKQICLYHFLDNEGIPFYVGVTNNFKRRKNEHNLYVRKQKRWAVYNKINKLILDHSYELRMEIIKDGLTHEEANFLEVETIKKYREKGYKLYNMCDGGEGIIGYKHEFTDEWRKKLSDAAKARVKRDGVPFKDCKHTDETRNRMKENRKDISGERNPFYGKKHNDKNIEASRERAQKQFSGIPKTEEHKRAISEATKGKRKTKKIISYLPN